MTGVQTCALPIFVCGAREDALVLHVRTITPRDEALVVEAFARIGTEWEENA